MLKKVKQKSYRSKREFQDDLDLIWSNCYTYNASEVWLCYQAFEQFLMPHTEPPTAEMCRQVKSKSGALVEVYNGQER